jgi:glycine/sarcosine N-methyltransferase
VGECVVARDDGVERTVDMIPDFADIADPEVDGSFDAVISCDNALPHLLTDEDLQRSLGSIRECLRPGGLLLASIRDYDALRATRPSGVPISVHGDVGSRHGSGQAWQWSSDGEYVDIELFTFTEDTSGSWQATSAAIRYRALLRATLERLLVAAGYTAVEWLMPEVSGYYQPIVLAKA